MALKRKAKAKAKVKRRKAPAKRTATRRKVAKVARKAKKTVRKVARKVAKKAARKPAPKRAAPAPVPVPEAPGVRIGVVTHFYGEPMVAVVKLESGTLRVGDRIHVRGHTSDFGQQVESLQIEHATVEEVGPGDDFGLKVVAHAREHDVVYKLP
jgi:translation elongation factor EF-Tu-like GTPase